MTFCAAAPSAGRTSATSPGSSGACSTSTASPTSTPLLDVEDGAEPRLAGDLVPARVQAVDELFELGFIREAVNVVFLGPNGVGKTMLAQNLAHHAILQGHTAHFTTASSMLGDLAAQDGAAALRRRLHRYVKPALLVVDELGYLPYSNRYADLLFEVVSQRYTKAPVVITTNGPFREWAAVFQSASCVGTLLDRLCHEVEIVEIAGESWRLKEANERTSRRRGRLPKQPG